MKRFLRPIVALVLVVMIAVTPVVASASPVVCEDTVGIQPFGIRPGNGIPRPTPEGE